MHVRFLTLAKHRVPHSLTIPDLQSPWAQIALYIYLLIRSYTKSLSEGHPSFKTRTDFRFTRGKWLNFLMKCDGNVHQISSIYSVGKRVKWVKWPSKSSTVKKHINTNFSSHSIPDRIFWWNLVDMNHMIQLNMEIIFYRFHQNIQPFTPSKGEVHSFLKEGYPSDRLSEYIFRSLSIYILIHLCIFIHLRSVYAYI